LPWGTPRTWSCGMRHHPPTLSPRVRCRWRGLSAAGGSLCGHYPRSNGCTKPWGRPGRAGHAAQRTGVAQTGTGTNGTAGVPRAKVLSARDSLVPVTNAARRMRPEHAWDWRRMIAVASGRVVHHTAAVGGPRAANRLGKAVAPGAVVQQTCPTMASLSQGLCYAGADGYDLVTLIVESPSQGAVPASRRRSTRGARRSRPYCHHASRRARAAGSSWSTPVTTMHHVPHLAAP
jgi:hypothetical protein